MNVCVVDHPAAAHTSGKGTIFDSLSGGDPLSGMSTYVQRHSETVHLVSNRECIDYPIPLLLRLMPLARIGGRKYREPLLDTVGASSLVPV